MSRRNFKDASTHVVGPDIPRSYEWGKGYVGRSHDSLGYGRPEDARQFLQDFMKRTTEQETK